MKIPKPHLPNCKCKHHEKPLNKSHPWYVNVPEYDNCFWLYMKYNNKRHTLLEIANLLNVSMSVITSVERRALKKLQAKMEDALKEKK